MRTVKNNNHFVDLVIAEAKPSLQKRIKGDYRICSVTRRGDQRFINLAMPKGVQRKILDAYAQGKQVRIFA